MPQDLPGRILRKISVPNAPFSCRLLPTPAATVVRKIFNPTFGEFQGAVFAVLARGATAPPPPPHPPHLHRPIGRWLLMFCAGLPASDYQCFAPASRPAVISSMN